MERIEKIELNLSPVRFIEETHTYLYGDKELKGITSTLLHRAFPDSLQGISEEVLKKAAERGHIIHEELMNIERWGFAPKSVEASNYIEERDKMGFTSIDSEYIVSDLKYYASAIDNVVVNRDGEICLIDYKTFYALDAERKQKVTLQLNLYKFLFEMNNPGLTVEHLYVAWFREASNGSHREFIELPFITTDILEKLIKADIENDESYVYNPLPDWVGDIEIRYAQALKKKEQIDSELDSMKQELNECMLRDSLTSFKSHLLTVNYIEGGKTTRFDAEALKKDDAETYKKYLKESTRKPSLRITINK